MDVLRFYLHRIQYHLRTPFVRRSLSRKLLAAFTLTIILPLSISFALSQLVIERGIIERVRETGTSSLLQVQRNIDDLLERMSSAALFLDGSRELKTVLASPPASPIERYHQASQVEELFNAVEHTVIREDSFLTVLTSDELLYTNHHQHRDLGDEIRKVLEWKPEVYENLRLHWLGTSSILHLYDTEDEYTFTLSKQMTLDPGAQRTAFLLISLPRQVLERQLEDPTPARFLLVDDEGRLVGASPGTEPAASYGRRLELPLGSDRGIATSRHQGTSYFVFRQPLNIGIWQLVHMIPREYVVGEIRAVRVRLTIVNVVFVLVFVLIALRISRSITVPIAALSAEMADVETLLEKQSSATRSRSDEIGVLQSSFEQMKVDLARLMQENAQKEMLKREAELEALQAQISPHFLFNTLNTVRWAAFNGNKQKVSEVVRSLGQLLRMTITHNEPLISLGEELELVEHYLSIVRSRHATSFRLEIDVDEEIRSAVIPKLLLQPLAENAVIHGFTDGCEDAILRISGRREGSAAEITVADNGTGFDTTVGPDRQKGIRFSSIGTENIEERIRLFFGTDYGLRVESNPGHGTRATLTIPLSREGRLG
jgi:two-component system, sensor histidine kinase YesM